MNFPDVGGGRSSGGLDKGLFIKLNDGDKVLGIFRGEPKIFRLHWINGRSQQCLGQDTCAHCKTGDRPKFRFHLNFITKVDGVWMAKVFEGSYQTYKDLKELHESDYNLEETALSIKRQGVKTDTRYVVMPIKGNGGLTAKEFKLIQAIPLNVLKEEKPEDAPVGEETDTNEDIPF